MWPGGLSNPPTGIPDKYHLRIVTLDEPPFVFVSDLDPTTGKCASNRAVMCEWTVEADKYS